MSREILEIGAGITPHPRSTTTLDIRDDLDYIDHSGVDIGEDQWPFEDESVDEVICYHVLEHVPPNRIGHVFQELDRVLVSGGKIHIELPHTASYNAMTDPTHYGGGWTLGIVGYFNGDLETYWPDIDWDVNAWAEITLPLFVRPEWRQTVRTTDPLRTYQLVKLPFVTADVVFEATKNE